jgi:hypothetical protein
MILWSHDPFLLDRMTDVNALNNGDIGMGNAAIALAILGFAVSVVFRLKTLLSILALLLVVSIMFSLARGFTFLDTALTVMAVQCVVQGGYFLGLMIRAVLSSTQRTPPVL